MPDVCLHEWRLLRVEHPPIPGGDGVGLAYWVRCLRCGAVAYMPSDADRLQ